MGFLKEKSSYRPTLVEFVLAWVLTAGSGVAVGWFVLRALLAGR